MIDTNIQILELFGGIGSPRKALINLGVSHKVIDYVEINEKMVRAYNALYDNRYKPQDVRGYNLKPDILIHGSPCQDFSRAGIRLGGKGEDKTRSSLMWETLKIIENMGVWKPRFVIWENVKGVLDKDMIGSFKKYLNEIERLGYESTFEVLSAYDFGIPQKRERIFVISILGGGSFNFDNLERKEVRHISEFLEPDEGIDLEKYEIRIPSMRRRIAKFNKGIEVKNFRYMDVIKDHCWTISTRQDRCPNAGIKPMESGEYRYLTERECWRLMGFSDEDFEEVLKEYPHKPKYRNATLYSLAGNSIVVQVLEAIFKELLKIK